MTTLHHEPRVHSATPGSRVHPGPLMGSQFLFNVGFYAVVPFIAVVLSDDFALGGTAVGLVLGVRTFAQQGMFLFGGVLADRFGARPTILMGCAVRATGFGALGLAVASEEPHLDLFVVGTVVTGLGGALFSPALNTLVAVADQDRVEQRHLRPRTTLFAVLAVAGESGAALGPVLGAALWGWGFATVAFVGAGLFAGVGLVLRWLLPAPHGERVARPAEAGRGARSKGGRRLWRSLRHPGFVAFAVVHSTELLAYNQLYMGLPVEMRRSGQGTEALAALFVVVSVITICFQVPVARWARRAGPQRALVTGYALLSSSFVIMAVSAPFPPPPGWELAPATAAVTVLVFGHLLAGPTALGLVPWFAGSAPRGSYYGLLASCGGVMVLLGNALVGTLYPLAEHAAPLAALPWIVMAFFPACAALLLPRILTITSRVSTPPLIERVIP